MGHETMFMRGMLIMLPALVAEKSASAIDFSIKEAIDKRPSER
jgi:hypothetical protein